jgi:NADH-quinone oxidoreductase subunit L
MLVPLGVLALGAALSGMVWYGSFFGHTDEVADFYGIPYAEAAAEGSETVDGAEEAHSATGDGAYAEHNYVFAGQPGEGAIYIAPDNTLLDDAHKVPYWVKTSPFAAMLLGFVFAYWFYIKNPSLPGRLAVNQKHLYQFLLNKWYFDEIYNFVFVKPASVVGRFLWKRGDGSVIDGGLNGLAMGIIPFFTRLAGKAQSGYIFTYAFAMVIGIAVLVTWMTLTGGAN